MKTLSCSSAILTILDVFLSVNNDCPKKCLKFISYLFRDWEKPCSLNLGLEIWFEFQLPRALAKLQSCDTTILNDIHWQAQKLTQYAYILPAPWQSLHDTRGVPAFADISGPLTNDLHQETDSSSFLSSLRNMFSFIPLIPAFVATNLIQYLRLF